MINPLLVAPLSLLVFAASFQKKINISWIERNDISYGVYLYHMIFINIALHCKLNGLASVGFVILATFLFAWLSWMYVEKKAIALKSHF